MAVHRGTCPCQTTYNASHYVCRPPPHLMRFVRVQFIPVLVFEKSECDCIKGRCKKHCGCTMQQKSFSSLMCEKNSLYGNKGDNTSCLGVYIGYESNCTSNVKLKVLLLYYMVASGNGNMYVLFIRR